MADGGTNYEAGLANLGGAGLEDHGGAYQGFVAYETSPTGNITLVHVAGLVRVPNPGVKPVLSYAIPQGPNPNILLLRLDLVQRPGIWPSVIMMRPAIYVGVALGGPYTQAQITNPQIGDHTVPFTR